ncbi:LMBR1-like membrane protein-domain-containing protein [Syncephalis pseudoplumigaleata]|uniref:LMBR1-like membrane protein-domain-containing protein n=1 Tax=Syncephalis pseudoplumigaleata TaxID=1712513 RepID=A0A4P9Z226_9FUNG|nr:LMBR1-like membrane protein-domain-containing protein [Syncephalis pseudoplumigaleata]|eukprot:RKP26524.1 LMBR1-like membrane protein-domain-containing protein [Syncephalis pseudoplumigaleata]
MGLGEVQLVDYILPTLLVLAPCFAVVGAIWRYAWEVRLSLLPGTIAAISWFVGFAVVALLPLDLSSTIYRRCSKQPTDASTACHQPAVYLSESTLWGLWRSIYWTTFMLNWIMIPVLQGFLQSGQFLFRRRLRNAIKGHAIYFGAYVILAVVAIVYILATHHFANWHAFLAFVMAAANCWGLLLVLLFMGHGLVAVPRTLWRAANTKRRWIQVTRRAVNVKDAYEEAETELVDVVACPISMVGSYQRVSIPRVITENKWERLLAEGFRLQDELENRDNPDRAGTAVVQSTRVAAAIDAIMLLWSELTMQWDEPMLSIYGLVLHWANRSYGLTEFVSILSLAYMCVCAYSSLLRMRIFNLYALVPRRSDVGSLLFMGGYLCRLTVPLCYNYLNLVVAQDDAVFSQFMGILDLVPFLGDRFNRWTPLIILVPSFVTFFRISDRVTRAFGCGDYSYDDDDGGNGGNGGNGDGGGNVSPGHQWRQEEAEEGRRLIQAERREVLRAMGIDPRGRLADRRPDRAHRGYHDVDTESSQGDRRHVDENALRLWIPANGPDRTAARARTGGAGIGQWTQKISSAVGSMWQRAHVTSTGNDRAGYARLQTTAQEDEAAMPGTPNDERIGVYGHSERIRMQPSARLPSAR